MTKSFLDQLAEMPAICRIYYGIEEPKIPKENYYWDDGSWGDLEGYYESDKALRERRKKGA
jgi:hypothetical protein